MLLENNKTTLIYGFNEDERSLIINEINSNYKTVDESMGKMKLRDILSGLKFEVYNCNFPNERLILFNNFEDVELNETIKKIKMKIQPAPIFAIITDTSIDWTLEYLLEHLVEEREWYRKQRK